MAAQAALLYQEAPVGVFLPNSAEKSRALPTSTSANRAAITSLIEGGFDSASRCLTAAMLGVEHHYGAEEAQLAGCFCSALLLLCGVELVHANAVSPPSLLSSQQVCD